MGRFSWKKMNSFRIIILGFAGVILLGALLLILPLSSREHCWTSFGDALFTSTSAVCVTGLVVKDTSIYWSPFGRIIILALIQIGGLGVVTIATFFTVLSGRRLSLLHRSTLQDSISAHHMGGIVKMSGFVFKAAVLIEMAGALVMMPSFCGEYGAPGIWLAVFHSVSAFCNAGFDVMGTRTGAFSSLTHFQGDPGVVIPVVLLIIIGGIGFLTWDDLLTNKLHMKRYRMQTKVILTTTFLLILVPMGIMFFEDFSSLPAGERWFSSLFQAVTPRTAGFNTVSLSSMTGTGHALMIILMLIGGSPGSTAGGMKTTTIAVLLANSLAVFRRKKNAQMFGRRIEDNTVKSASTLLVMYLFLTFSGAFLISLIEKLPIKICIFETASAIGTVGLSLGITPDLGILSHLILILLMFFGRVGGLTLIYAALSNKTSEISQCPVEKIMVG